MSVTFLLIDLLHYTAVAVLASDSRVARRQHDEVDTVLQAAAPQGSVSGLVAIDHRVIKQSHSGNDSRRTKVRLTPQGEGFMLLNRIVTATFGIDPQFVARSASRTHS